MLADVICYRIDKLKVLASNQKLVRAYIDLIVSTTSGAERSWRKPSAADRSAGPINTPSTCAQPRVIRTSAVCLCPHPPNAAVSSAARGKSSVRLHHLFTTSTKVLHVTEWWIGPC
jgi:hypothetical protein